MAPSALSPARSEPAGCQRARGFPSSALLVSAVFGISEAYRQLATSPLETLRMGLLEEGALWQNLALFRDAGMYTAFNSGILPPLALHPPALPTKKAEMKPSSPLPNG